MKSKVTMMISLIILLVISIITVSLGWYISQAEIEAKNASVGAEQSAAASISSFLIEESHYGGHLGHKPAAHEDAPYIVYTEINVSASNVLDNTKLKITLAKLIISKGQLSDTSLYVENTNSPEDNMTFRLISSGTRYLANADGFIVKESNPAEYYTVVNGVNQFQLEIIFLNEESYLQWEQDSVSSLEAYNIANPPGVEYFDWLEGQPQYFNYDPCVYSAPLYMYTNFYLTIEYTTEV